MALLFNEAFTHWVIISILLITGRIGFLNPNCWAQAASEAEAFRLGQFSKCWATAKLKMEVDSRSQAYKDPAKTSAHHSVSSVTYSIVLYLLTILWLNKKQLGHPWWLLADCSLVPWTLCFSFTLALVFIQSMKGQTLTAAAGPQFWLTCPVLFSVVLKRPHGARTEYLHFSKSPAFPFICLITQILLSLWPINHFWLKHFGKYDPLSQPLFLLVFRALLHVWHGNCFTQQQR